jgi:predicted dehydrogenase
MSEQGAAGEQGKIRSAVAGAGEFGRNHARVYREMDSVELVGVVDQNSARTEAMRKSLGYGVQRH